MLCGKRSGPFYRIDASSIDSDLSSAQTSLQRAKESVQTAQSAYAGERQRGSPEIHTAPQRPDISRLSLYIKEGDKVNSGTKIADLYDDSVMKITGPVPLRRGGGDQRG